MHGLLRFGIELLLTVNLGKGIYVIFSSYNSSHRAQSSLLPSFWSLARLLGHKEYRPFFWNGCSFFPYLTWLCSFWEILLQTNPLVWDLHRPPYGTGLQSFFVRQCLQKAKVIQVSSDSLPGILCVVQNRTACHIQSLL